MWHTILGADGVSELVGSALARNGHPVTLLVQPGRQHHYSKRLAAVQATVPIDTTSSVNFLGNSLS